MQRALVALSLLLALCSGGCSILPAGAPTQAQVEERHDASWDFYLVPVNVRMLDILNRSAVEPIPANFYLGKYKPSIALRTGDSVSVSIFEAGGPSLFGTSAQPAPSISTSPDAGSSGSGRASSLPPQTIEANGDISIPFAGNVHVAGKTPIEAANAIAEALSTQAVKPQVLVTLVSSVSNNATIAGDVNKPGLVGLSLRGERLIDVIAAAGGSRYAPMDSQLRIVRRNEVANIQMSAAVQNPRDNIIVRPGDSIVLLHKPRTYAVMGAAQRVAQFGFDTERVSVTEALARAGGDIDITGDLGGIYIFRNEPIARAEAIFALDPTKAAPGGVRPLSGPFVPIIYKLNLLQPEGYMLAKGMQMHDKDVILISNAVGAQLVKAFIIARGATGIVFDLTRTGTAGN